MTTPDRATNGFTASGGFTLMEVILAMAVFAMAAVGLMAALNQISLASLESTDSARLTRMLRSHLTEVIQDGTLKPGSFKSSANEEGIGLETIVEELSLQSDSGQRLTQMYRVEVIAARDSSGIGGGEVLDRAETWVYRPLYPAR